MAVGTPGRLAPAPRPDDAPPDPGIEVLGDRDRPGHPPAPAPGGRRRRAAGWPVPVGLGVLAALPLLAALATAVAQLDGTWWPVGDSAVLELGTRDAGRDPGLLGPYSRFGWNHPGPAAFYLFALPYRLTGDASLALALAAVLVNLASVVGIALLALRRGGRGLLAATVVLLALLLRLLGPEVLRDPWNPYVTVLPVALLAFLCWSVADGGARLLPVAVAVGSAVAQTHLGYSFPVAALLLGALGLLVAGAARRGEPRRLALPLVLAGVVGAGLWAPVVAEELRGDPGNLTLLREYLDTPRKTPDTGDAARVTATQLGRLTADAAGRDEVRADGLAADGPLWPAAVTAAAALAGAALAARRRDAPTLRLAALAALVAGAALVATTGVDGVLYRYLVVWVPVGGLLAWAVLASSVREQLARAAPVAVAAALVLAVGAAGTADAWSAGLPQRERSRDGGRLARQVLAEVGPASASCPVLVRFAPEGGWVHGTGLALQLERRGWDVRGDEQWRPMLGRRATGPPEGEHLVLTVADGEGPTPPGEVVARAGGARVARTSGCA